MAEESAAETLRAIVSWSRYAEYFAFDEEADLFSLENQHSELLDATQQRPIRESKTAFFGERGSLR